jgi:hypothetical protein
MNTGNDSVSQQGDERYEGSVTNDLDVLSLGLTDDEIAQRIGNRLGAAESFWNAKLGLDGVREKVEKFWLNSYYSEDDLFDFQSEYKDNRIFNAIETLVALVTSNPPQPLATQAYDTEASYELAQQLQKALLSKYEDLYLKSKFQLVARHILMGYRLGVMKYSWDDTIGKLQPDGSRFGDISVNTLRPQRIVIDAAAQDINDIPLIGEYKTAMLEDMLEMYPAKRDEIIMESGKNKGVAIDMTKREGYVELHFTTREKNSKKRIEAIAWKYKTIVLDNTKSPFWNYEEYTQSPNGDTVPLNFLDKPTKPYAVFNFLNLGKWVIDDTSLTDQAIPLQKIHDKRGRQIVENADQANGGWVFDTTKVKAEDAAAWRNDPGDKILAKGNVNEAVARLPAPILPDYVLQDKIDARQEIDNIFGTHGATRGETTGNKTLGQDVMSQRGDSARLNVLATAMEDGADRLFKGIVQLMKVFYDEPQLIRYNPQTDSTMFFSFGQNQIEPGASLRVKTGSVLPEDPIAKKQDTIQMLPILDPLSMAEGLGKENPKEWAKRNVYYRLAPDKYLSEILGVTLDQGGAQDPLALQHIQLLSSGKEVPPEVSPTKEHLATHQAFVQSPEFQQLPPDIQQLHMLHVKGELQNAKSAMGMGDTRPGVPTPQQPVQPETNTPPTVAEPSAPPNQLQQSAIMNPPR